MAGEIVSGAIVKLLLFTILVGNSLCMNSNVDITCSSDDSCMETYKLHGFPKGIRYQGSDILNGTLEHGITIASDGKCFKPRFQFRGISDLEWAFWNLPKMEIPMPVKELNGKQLKETLF